MYFQRHIVNDKTKERMKKLLTFLLALGIFGLFACNTNTTETEVEAPIVETPEEVVVDEAAVDTLTNAVKDLEAELDDVLEGLE